MSWWCRVSDRITKLLVRLFVSEPTQVPEWLVRANQDCGFEVSSHLVECLNRERLRLGVPPLWRMSLLDRAAELQAIRVVLGKNHYAAGILCHLNEGEKRYFRALSFYSTVVGLFEEPLHRELLLSQYWDEIGICLADHNWYIVLAKRDTKEPS
jgi:hypothetical protein